MRLENPSMFGKKSIQLVNTLKYNLEKILSVIDSSAKLNSRYSFVKEKNKENYATQFACSFKLAEELRIPKNSDSYLILPENTGIAFLELYNNFYSGFKRDKDKIQMIEDIKSPNKSDRFSVCIPQLIDISETFMNSHVMKYGDELLFGYTPIHKSL